MKPVELRKALTEEIALKPLNVSVVLATMKEENPYEYNVICGFVSRCKNERERMQKRKNRV